MTTETGRVIRVWRKGRAYPLLVALVLVAIVLVVWRVSPYWFNSLRADMIILVAIAVLAVLAAFGRRLTLTTDTLIMRQFNGTKTVPLADIVLVVQARPGYTRPAVLQPLWVKLANGNWRRSKALGWSKDEGIEIIKRAVRSAGGTLERDESTGRLGPSPFTDPGPIRQEWTKGRFVPLSGALVALVLLVFLLVQAVQIDERFGDRWYSFVEPQNVLVLVVFVLALLTAFGRRLTLTKNTLVVRKMLGLHRIVLPLREVVSIAQRGTSIGATSPWQPVFVQLRSGKTISTKSLGADAGPGIEQIRQAVTAAGGRLEART